MDTIRELIIKDFLARATVIRTSSPAEYNTDIGQAVHRAKKELIPDTSPAEVPGCNIWPQPETAEKKYGHRVCSMQIHIEGTDFYEDENPSVVSELILGDLKEAFLSTSWSRSPDYIDEITYLGGGTDSYPDEENKITGSKIAVEIKYQEAIGNPYSQGG